MLSTIGITLGRLHIVSLPRLAHSLPTRLDLRRDLHLGADLRRF